MNCNQCGTQLPPGATHCNNCGYTVIQQPPSNNQPMNQGQYTPPMIPAMNTEPLTVGSYLLMFVIMSLPLINLIMLFVWGFGDSNENRKNFARAGLIMIAISIVLSVVLGGIMSAFMFQMIEESGMMY